MKSRGLRRSCNGTSQVHIDAKALVQYVFDAGGSTAKTNDQLAQDLALVKSHGGGHWSLDKARYGRARNHTRDGQDAAGKPCCGYTLHYRTSKDGDELFLIDPSGSLGAYAKVALAEFRGRLQVVQRHQTEDRRIMETLELLADHVLAQGDRDGFRILTKAATEMDSVGTISPTTMGEMEVWLASL